MSNDDLNQLLKHMKPYLVPGKLVFITLDNDQLETHINASIAMVKEAEGVTFVLPQSYADECSLSYDGTYRQISLTVQSALEGFGLVAAFATALANHGVPANVFAGYYHDHILVPERLADTAVQALEELSRQAA